MKIYQYATFFCPILKAEINLDNKKIIKYVNSIQKKDKGRVITNQGGYQSFDLNLKDKELQLLLLNIKQSVLSYVDYIGFKKNLNYKIDSLWCNVNYYKDSNSFHTHPNCLFSGVYYVKTPKDCGNIVFLHPGKETMIYDWKQDLKENFNEINSSNWIMPSHVGSLYIFPSWLRHSVLPNLNKKEERISIAFNIGVTTDN
jgi:uncharacterized protein (TIGR02466 family)